MMSNDSGSAVYCDEYGQQIQEQLSAIERFRGRAQSVNSAADLEALENEIRGLTDRLGGLLIGEKLQHALSTEALQSEERSLVASWPKRLSRDGVVKVNLRTAQGVVCEVQTSYYRRQGKSGSGQRRRGLYPGLALLGIYDRCTPGLASEVSQLSAIVGSLDEARSVVFDPNEALRPWARWTLLLGIGAPMAFVVARFLQSFLRRG